ncbi:ATP-binding cassette sub-family D member 4 [Lamellibrachia satsuma]|nr:ATP-binding cassette sub-family D member 4 [Lamellibrachia satsuma]
MLHAIGLVMAVAFVMATDKYICNVFYVTSRSIVTRHLHTEYFKDIHYYQLNVLDDTIDNPDQRITQDVDRTCNKLSEIVARLLISPFTIAYYVYQTWTSTGYLGPLCVVGFFLMSTFINKLLMSPVVALVYRQERLEGDFRFKHMQVRSNAESAAFYRCGRMERDKADARLDKLVNTQQKLVLREYFLSFSIQCADYLGSILSYVILAIPIFLGKYDDLTPAELSALISKNAFVTIYLISCFTRLIDMASQVTDLAGTTHRIGQLMDELSSLEEVSQHHPPPTNDIMNTAVPSIQTTYMAQGKVAFSLEGVSYTPPGSDRMLVKDLTWQLAKGMNVLVTGDSGCGKTSLLRVLDGLWNTICSGTVDRPIPHARNGVLYLPQKPFFTDGTLRQQVFVYCDMNPKVFVYCGMNPKVFVYCGMNPKVFVYCGMNPKVFVYCGVNPKVFVYCSVNPKVFVYCGVNPKVFVYCGMNPKVFVYCGMNPKVFVYCGVNPKVFVYCGVNPKVFVYCDMNPKVFVYCGMNPKVFVYCGVNPKVFVYCGVNPKVFVYCGVNPKVFVYCGVNPKVFVYCA